MSRIPLNLAAIADSQFPVLSPGVYTLLVKDVLQKASKASGELVLSVTFEVQDGPNGSPESAGKKLFSTYSLQEKAAWRVKKLCVAVGMSADEIAAGVDDELLLGRTIRADVAVEKYNGRDQNRVGNETPVNAVATGNGSTVSAGSFAPSGFQMPATGAVPAGWGAPNTAMPTPPPAKPVS